MKKILFLVFVLNALFITAQTYSISPAKTVTFTAVLNDITIHDIFQPNTGNAPITLIWERISVNLPPSWGYSMCDLGTCHPGIPAGPTTMSLVPVGGKGLLGLNVDPGNIPGSGIVKVFVYQSGFKPNGDTLTWYINANAVGLEDLSTNGPIKIFPNPATNQLNISSEKKELISLNISDALGRKVLSLALSPNTNMIDISGLQKGYYMLNIETLEKHLFKRIIKE